MKCMYCGNEITIGLLITHAARGPTGAPEVKGKFIDNDAEGPVICFPVSDECNAKFLKERFDMTNEDALAQGQGR